MTTSARIEPDRQIKYLLLAVLTIIGNTGVGAQGLQKIDDVLQNASSYVEAFMEDLSTVVMEEEYGQSSFSGGGGGAIKINLRSEFLLVPLRGSDTWMGFRDVFEVNGRRVQDREDRLAALFIDNSENPTTALAQARQIAEESSRYNVGSIHRTFNIPTYTLLILHPSNIQRFRFSKDGEDCAGVDPAGEIEFEETYLPTLTRGFNGINLPADGQLCVDPSSGRVFETEINLHHPSVGETRPATNVKATVKFSLESNIGMLLPEEMRERYSEQGGGNTTSTARYRNYRQFGVTTNEDWEEPPLEDPLQ